MPKSKIRPGEQMTGDTIGSAVLWRWEGSYWEATVEDGSILHISLHRRKGGSRWLPHVALAPCLFGERIISDERDGRYSSADDAKRAAFDWYMRARKRSK